MTDYSKLARRWDADNRTAAEIILADVGKYGGADALPVICARMVQERAATPQRRVSGPRLLFHDQQGAA